MSSQQQGSDQYAYPPNYSSFGQEAYLPYQESYTDVWPVPPPSSPDSCTTTCTTTTEYRSDDQGFNQIHNYPPAYDETYDQTFNEYAPPYPSDSPSKPQHSETVHTMNLYPSAKHSVDPNQVRDQANDTQHLYAAQSNVQTFGNDQQQQQSQFVATSLCGYCPGHDSGSPPKFNHFGKRIGRPRIDRSNTRCERCGTSSTPQWRYLPTAAFNSAIILRRSGIANSDVVQGVPMDDRRLPIDLHKSSKICLCNACWLRAHKSKQRRSFLPMCAHQQAPLVVLSHTPRYSEDTRRYEYDSYNDNQQQESASLPPQNTYGPLEPDFLSQTHAVSYDVQS